MSAEIMTANLTFVWPNETPDSAARAAIVNNPLIQTLIKILFLYICRRTTKKSKIKVTAKANEASFGESQLAYAFLYRNDHNEISSPLSPTFIWINIFASIPEATNTNRAFVP